MMTVLLWAHFVLLAGLAGLLVLYVWAEASRHE